MCIEDFIRNNVAGAAPKKASMQKKNWISPETFGFIAERSLNVKMKRSCFSAARICLMRIMFNVFLIASGSMAPLGHCRRRQILTTECHVYTLMCRECAASLYNELIASTHTNKCLKLDCSVNVESYRKALDNDCMRGAPKECVVPGGANETTLS